MTYFEYSMEEFKKTFERALEVSRNAGQRVFMRPCTCDMMDGLHYAISTGSSNNYLHWLNRNGQ